ncbi:MAG TPA: class II aldolase/adducin family protein [Naasia sp.]
MTDPREQLVASARHLAARGLSPGSSGNLSLRTGATVLLTPTGSSLSRVLPEDLAEVALDDGRVLSGRPSKELPLHLAVYAERDASAVVHLHSPYATAIACLPPAADGTAALPPLTPYRVMRLGAVPVAPYAAPGSADLADGVRRLAGAHAAMLLASHGPVAAAASLDAAVDLAEELETAAQLTLLTAGRGPVLLSADQVSALWAH